MGFLDLFKRPKTAAESALEEMRRLLHQRVFPGGDQELLFRAKKTMELSNGKLDLPNAGRVYGCAKSRIWLASTEFDGEQFLGVKGEELLSRTRSDSENKLSTFEAAAIIVYALYDKVDPGNDAVLAVKQWADGCFGLGERGTDLDEIPEGIGEFGLEPTNPVPVRGIFSNAIYLGRLRTNGGHQLTHKRVRSITVPNIWGNVDEYDLIREEKVLCQLYISPYNRKISNRPPTGFLLVKKD